MILTVFELITMSALLGLAFLLGRIIWEIRQQEILWRDHERAGFRQPTFPSIVSASRSLHWCRQCIVADGSGTLSLVRVFSLVEPQRQRQNLLEGDGEDATHSGITTRESGTTAARARRDAAGDRGLQRADNEVPPV